MNKNTKANMMTVTFHTDEGMFYDKPSETFIEDDTAWAEINSAMINAGFDMKSDARHNPNSMKIIVIDQKSIGDHNFEVIANVIWANDEIAKAKVIWDSIDGVNYVVNKYRNPYAR